MPPLISTWSSHQALPCVFDVSLKLITTLPLTFKAFVDFQSLSQVSRALVVNLIVREVQMSKHLSREKEFSDLSSTRVTDFVMRKIQLTDGLVQNQTLNENTD